MSKTQFGPRLYKLRKERGMTARALAGLVGVSPTAVNNWEKHGTVPRDETFGRIAVAIGVPVEFLKDGTGAPSQSAPNDRSDTLATALAKARELIAAATGIDRSRIRILVQVE